MGRGGGGMSRGGAWGCQQHSHCILINLPLYLMLVQALCVAPNLLTNRY